MQKIIMKKIFTYLFTILSTFFFAQNDGTLDTNFGTSGFLKYDSQSYGTCLELDSNQNLIVGTYRSQTFKFYRFSQIGQLDASFGSEGEAGIYLGGQNAVLYDMKILPNNKIMAVGYWNDGSNRVDFIVIRLNADGSLDTSFNNTGKLTIAFGTGEDVAKAVTIQSDGKILVAGESFTGSYKDIAVARINTNGTLDTTFSDDGKLTTDVLGNDDYVRDIAINKDGKFAVTGYSYGPSSAADFAVVKYNTNGSLDTSFSVDGKQVITLGPNNDNPIGIAFQNDNKIIVGGAYFSSINNRDDFAIIRLNANGTLDTTFNGDGIFSTAIGNSDDTPQSMKLQSDGKILLLGNYRSGSYTDIALIRVTNTGYLDPTFGTNGITKQSYMNGSYFRDMVLTNNGKIYLVGYANLDILLARFNSSIILSAADNKFNEIELFPNPVVDVLNFNQNIEKTELYSLDGKLIRTDNNIDRLNLNNLPKGVYNLKMNIVGNQNEAVVKKIIKK
ncbi:T9SS type A sorting domain-containing protein [Epilithonimonas sp. JDS]|uniref:T9SS type A sorting domain-containing protein n=1 Tax=Epilithonimonas sp. JDS TaxID=2902797 RepID=UPI001E537FEF|nr:T9SS type A sorting domain-containing protein [Epilithonimonas sp. JDS]